MELVATPREMTVVLAARSSGARAFGRRTAVFTDGGGHGVIAADAAEAAGLDVPELGAAAQNRLRALLWEQSAVGNPVDLAGMGEQNPRSYAETVGGLLAMDEVDAVLMSGYFGGYAASGSGLGGGGATLAEGEAEAARDIVAHWRARPKPLVVQSMYPKSPSCRTLAGAGIPVFSATEDAARALAAMAVLGGPPGLAPSAPAPPLRGPDTTGSGASSPTAGVPYPQAREITGEAELLSAADEFAGPYVLKALHVLHKSDAGGVALRLTDRPALLAAYRAMHARLGAPSYSVEAMADLDDGIELIVGVNRDPRFGPVAMVGLGGVLTEALHDVAFALAPFRPPAPKSCCAVFGPPLC